jgi:hypothetical protein
VGATADAEEPSAPVAAAAGATAGGAACTTSKASSAKCDWRFRSSSRVGPAEAAAEDEEDDEEDDDAASAALPLPERTPPSGSKASSPCECES